MKRLTCFILFCLLTSPVTAQTSDAPPLPIIDMHLHALRANGQGPPGQPMCPGGGLFLPWTQEAPLRLPSTLD